MQLSYNKDRDCDDNKLNAEEFFKIFLPIINKDSYYKQDILKDIGINIELKNNLPIHSYFLNGYKEMMAIYGINYGPLDHYLDFLDLLIELYDFYERNKNNDDLKCEENILNCFIFYCDFAFQNLNIETDNICVKHNYKEKKRTLHILCLDPSFGFKKILERKPKTVILTSGTLAPFSYLENELRLKFNITLASEHVILAKQIKFAIVTNSLIDLNLNIELVSNKFSNKNYLKSLGESILTLLEKIKYGILIFFPSYFALENIYNIWKNLGIIKSFEKHKKIIVDSQDIKDKESLLYQLKDSCSNNSKEGVLMSICRGAFSEGVNYDNCNIRMVIVLGLPCANIKEPKIYLRKEYLAKRHIILEDFLKEKGISSLHFHQWYFGNALKATNQALGRLIRNKHDFGTVLLIDNRYNDDNKKNLISNWINKYKIIYKRKQTKNLITDLESFYEYVEKYKKDF